MSVKIVQERFDSYRCESKQAAENAMAEIAQEIALAGLSRSDFFKRAAFQGGTCLRILHGMQRFSEDLDFLLIHADRAFELAPYLRHISEEFRSYGIGVEVQDRSRADDSVKKAFLKSDSLGKVLSIQNVDVDKRVRNLRIKFEVDSRPPEGSGVETKYLDFPVPFSVAVQDLPSLFAGKSHALLCREYVKGRDWFDFVWYVGHKVKLNYAFLSSAVEQQGPWAGRGIEVTRGWYLEEMSRKIASIDWDDARRDVERFLRTSDLRSVEFWSDDFFRERIDVLRSYLL